MSSILVSFIGNQDPFSDKNHIRDTDREGSLVTLTRHLTHEFGQSIRRVILLYTADNALRKNACCDWLSHELKLPIDCVEAVEVSAELSEDPIDSKLAINEARRGIELANQYRQQGDILELNASSGTPAMKMAWSILHTVGFSPDSRVWQIRNPKESRPDQYRVFQSDTSFLRTEIDSKILEQQLQNFDYVGAQVVVENPSSNKLVS